MKTKTATVRFARPEDASRLAFLDLKCYENPLQSPDWKDAIASKGDLMRVAVALDEKEIIVGYASWAIPGADNPLAGRIGRLGVHPAFRRKGYGSQIVDFVGRSVGALGGKTLETTVAEVYCAPGAPDDVSGFLAANNFRATGDIVRDYMSFSWHTFDGIKFRRELSR